MKTSNLLLFIFNSTTITLINSEYDLDKSFQEILYRIDNWINEDSCWVIKSMDGEYFNISIYSPLSGSSYIQLPNNLRKSMKGLININQAFKSIKTHLQRIAKADKKWLMILIMKVLNFLSLKKIIARLNKKIIFALMYFVMKMI